ncbi:hypothetical protein JRO89_XS03G0244300 [Xanthoceras sorbifolium]|uniref:Uncharacterized protein n=1 Tax=Xanthoceras sorbifolium TaxID=99658 RepID=A0ABQ8ICQ2_9ROSI|nr:hypothetical protein JRO89_XS03G0244300 [Xanthoceras sorbifolium]
MTLACTNAGEMEKASHDMFKKQQMPVTRNTTVTTGTTEPHLRYIDNVCQMQKHTAFSRGLVQEGYELFSRMEMDSGIAPQARATHYLSDEEGAYDVCQLYVDHALQSMGRSKQLERLEE